STSTSEGLKRSDGFRSLEKASTIRWAYSLARLSVRLVSIPAQGSTPSARAGAAVAARTITMLVKQAVILTVYTSKLLIGERNGTGHIALFAFQILSQFI